MLNKHARYVSTPKRTNSPQGCDTLYSKSPAIVQTIHGEPSAREGREGREVIRVKQGFRERNQQRKPFFESRHISECDTYNIIDENNSTYHGILDK